jgi:uncharacterized protein (TIGR00255 family)
MIKSMTGYGKGRGAVDGLALTVEVKSVNHRYSDIAVKAPRALLCLEGEVKKRVGERLKRGKIDVFIGQELSGAALVTPGLNLPLASAYVEVFRELRAALDLEGEIPLGLVATQKDVVVVREEDLPVESARTCLMQALDQALEAVEGMRLAEGAATFRDVDARFELVEGFLSGVEKRAPMVPREWQAKLAERLERLGGGLAGDPQRVAQEIAIFSDRCDISEEITRFKSHLEQFRQLLESADPVGRQLDFLLQELNRETNTMGSKSNDAELTRQVVGLKAELEKIREQVQNIE